MRDKRFIPEHRGGPLKKEQHYQLINWTCGCAEHVLPLLGEDIDGRLIHALNVGRSWAQGNASVGDARKTSVAMHALARESQDMMVIELGRAVGHAVATAHMADHSLVAALYALKAVKSAGKSVAAERNGKMNSCLLRLRS
ncbi:MAG: hypothetical protein LUQ24_05000 [Methanobacterium sp.]|nr:hypothetical protein [Methanobacterium sp.]